VLNRIPEAKLLVMGSGKLYGEAELGKLGIASTKYEQLLEKYILDTQGNIIPSVKFLGVVGEGKEEIFRKASVGIVNPSGRTETFGMGVVEMGEARLPVVTIGKNGYFDTVQSGKSGILSKSLDTMADDIVKLLTDHSLNKKMGDEAKRNNQRFLPSVIGPQWDVLLEDIYSDTLKFEILKPSRPYSNNFKWIRICISKIRFGLGIRYIPSMIKIESYLVKLLYK
ncbi:glycosyltransferase, partial [Bacteroides thetaiotaomicron]